MRFTYLPIGCAVKLNKKILSLKLVSILIFLYLAIFSIAANAQENGSMSYSKINKMLTIIDEYAKSPYTGLIATISPEEQGIQLADIQLTIVHENNIIKQLTVAADGRVDFPLLASEIGDKAKLEINQPKGSVSIAMTAGIKPIKAHRVSYGEVIGVLDDLETVASELVGVPSWLIPDIDEIEFVFDSPATITLQNKKSTKVHQTNSELEIQIERNDDWQSSNAELVFSDLPVSVTIVN